MVAWNHKVAVLRVSALAIVLATCAGCPQYADPRVPNPIRQESEPEQNGKYLVYAPTRYSAETPTSLVVLCHGTKPWDNPNRQIRDWVKLAEDANFIVAAPHLRGTRGDFPPPAARQVELQREDERTILSTVRHIRGGYNIRPDRIFLCGWSAGGYAVLYTGLKHPDVFRALVVLQGNFDAVYLSEVADRIDPYQPVLVLYGSTDVLTGAHGKECADWLYKQNAYVFHDRLPGPHRSHPKQAFDFCEGVIRKIPWLRIRTFSVGQHDPYSVRFDIWSSFEPSEYLWNFGDGESSPVASPTHSYPQDGSNEYTVTLEARAPGGGWVKRSIQVQVPVGGVRHDLGN